MDCCQGIERQFDSREAASRLRAYQKRGPSKTTRILLAALEAQGIADTTLLDIGGGVGDIELALLRAGIIRSATAVDASAAYLATAKAEAARLGYGDRVAYHHGDFVDLAPEIAPAGFVTLDRVICCYRDMPALVGASASKADRLYGVVYPRDSWWVRLLLGMANGLLGISGRSFRVFAHPTSAVDDAVRAAGLEQCVHRFAGVWQICVYQRVRAANGAA